MSNDRIGVVGTNIAEKATMIWNVADMLRGPFKPHEYGLVVLAIDNLIIKKENAVEELEVYKKSLIYEYVTGKKEVPS